jgi:2-oxoisovalerate dehydrogenase E1 component alpha subunit
MATAQVRPRGGSGETHPAAPALPAAQLRQMYSDMLLARLTDERCWLLNRGGKAPFVISCQGQEAVQVGSVHALDRKLDWFAPYYRDLGVVMSLGMTPEEILRSVLGKQGDPNSGARQMPSHFGSRRLRIISQGSPVGTQCLHAVGTALASKIKGDGAVSINYVGEGGTSQGDWHEALNFASIHRLPVIFMVENNSYAISVPIGLQMAVKDVASRAQGYGMPGVVVDGQDPVAVFHATKEAADRARSGGGPTLIEAKTHRFTSHSSDDDQRVYRASEELSQEAAQDPIPRFSQVLKEAGLMSDQEEVALRAELQLEVDRATQAAEDAPTPDPEEVFLHVYGESGPSGQDLSGDPRFDFGDRA